MRSCHATTRTRWFLTALSIVMFTTPFAGTVANVYAWNGPATPLTEEKTAGPLSAATSAAWSLLKSQNA